MKANQKFFLFSILLFLAACGQSGQESQKGGIGSGPVSQTQVRLFEPVALS